MKCILQSIIYVKDSWKYDPNTYSNANSPINISNVPLNFKMTYKAYHGGTSWNGLYVTFGSMLNGTHTVNGGNIVLNLQGSPKAERAGGSLIPRNTWYDVELTYEDGIWTLNAVGIVSITLNYEMTNRECSVNLEDNSQIKEILIMEL